MGSFNDYLNLIRENPKITRNAFQRMYDMVMEKGTDEYVDVKKQIVHYKFFDDAENDGKDAVYGAAIPLMKLVNVLCRAAALGYGTEKRVILLHGPVGSGEVHDLPPVETQGLETLLENHSGGDLYF